MSHPTLPPLDLGGKAPTPARNGCTCHCHRMSNVFHIQDCCPEDGSPFGVPNIKPEPMWPGVSAAGICRHPDHAPPSMLYIPPGQYHLHTCPGCGTKFRTYGGSTTL